MRTGKVVLIAVAALIVYSGIAHAITVKKKRDAPGEPAAVWALIGSFCAIKNWHPAVADCETTKEGEVISRTLTLKDGSKIKESLTDTEETSYTYAMAESSLPVKNYRATLSVEEDEDSPDRSEIHWEATFDAQGASDEDARKKIAEILEAGVAGMKKVAIEYEIKKGDGSGEVPSSGDDTAERP
jgi:Polyketide cyclase / dehydrase and lipid transport